MFHRTFCLSFSLTLSKGCSYSLHTCRGALPRRAYRFGSAVSRLKIGAHAHYTLLFFSEGSTGMFFLPYRKKNGAYVHTTSNSVMPSTATTFRDGYDQKKCVYSGTLKSKNDDDILGGMLMARKCEEADLLCQKRVFCSILRMVCMLFFLMYMLWCSFHHATSGTSCITLFADIFQPQNGLRTIVSFFCYPRTQESYK